jgi:putative transposase
MKPISKKRIKNSTFWRPSLEKGYIKKTNSWFDISVKKLENTERTPREIKTNFIRCEKITIKPSQKQRNILKTWLEIYRQVYNITVKYYRKHKILPKRFARTSVRAKINKNTYLTSLIKNSAIPIHTINNAIFDVLKAYKTAFSNLKNKNIKYFRIRPKKFNKPTQILVLEPNVFNKEKTGLNNINLRDLHPSSPISTQSDVRLQFNKRTKQFTLFIPQNMKFSTTKARYARCALDPGMRAFQTTYSNSGVCYQIGTNKTNQKIKKTIAKIESVSTKKNEKWYNKFASKLRERIKNLVADLHWKTARFLCQRFDTILIGNMSTKDIIKSTGSVLNACSKRFCQALSHFTFRERLKTKCEQYNVQFKCVDESYTSKTCGSCGELNDKLGGAETFKCAKERCSYTMLRDIHGARNILIKHTKN